MSRGRRERLGALLWWVGRALLFPALMASSTALAQGTPSDSSQHRPYQVGVSASSLVKLLEEEDPTHQYQVYGRYWATDRRMLRAALRYRQVVGDPSEVDVGLRGGAARVFTIDERWRFYGGGDLLAGYRRFANGNVSYRMGLSPLFGVLFFASPHVSLSVEPRLLAAYARSRGSIPDRATSGSFSIEIGGVGLLILSVHF